MNPPGHGGHALVGLAVLAFGLWVLLAARRPADAGRDLDGPPVRMLAAASLVAAAAHAAATPHHVTEHALYGVFFVGVTLAQFAYVVAILRPGTPSPRFIGAAALGNAAVLATWVVSRTVGVPIGPHRTPEAIGAVDLTAAAAEMLLLALSAVWLVTRTLTPKVQPVGVRSAFPVGVSPARAAYRDRVTCPQPEVSSNA